MSNITKYSAIISFLLSSFFLTGCVKEIARATGDAYQGIGGVISDYGHGKYEDNGAQHNSNKKSKNQTYTDRNTIKFVQKKLNELNYNAGTPDGIYGSKTRNALRSFQGDASIPITGEIDSISLSKLKEK